MRARPGVLVAVAAGTLLMLGLAVLGLGGLAAFLSHPPLVVLALATGAMAAAAPFSQGNLSPGEREDRGNRWIIPVLGIIGLLSAFLPAYDDRKDILTLDGEALRWLGVVIFVLGGVLRLWPVFVLGRRFSGLVTIQPGHTLVTTGLYGTIRHPSYLGLLAGALGWALAFRSGIGVLLAALNLVPVLARIRAEEALLLSQFGEAYKVYRRRTWRLLPGLW